MKNFPRTLKAGLTILVCLLAFVSRSSSHEPITTSVTFNKEIIRIFQRNCLACHRTGGVRADIPLMTYEQARPWAKAIKEEILERRMPPFQAVKGYGSFQNGYFLPQRDVELIISWVEGGAPRGKTEDVPKEIVPAAAWSLGKPDLNLQPGQMIVIPASKSDAALSNNSDEETRCIKLPTNLKQDRWINAVEFIPTTSAVLSAEFLIERKGSNCEGERIGSWVPGQSPVQLPENTAFLLPANSVIVMKLRYRRGEQEISDHSILGVYFAKGENARQVKAVSIMPTAAMVPVDAARHRVKASYLLKEATEAMAVRPLLFPLGKSVEVTAFRPDGTAEVLVIARNYRYDWQPLYQFKNPVLLPAGTRVEVTAYLDNSDNNANLSDESRKAVKLTNPLCQLLVAKAADTNVAAGKTQSVASSSSVHKH